MIRWHGTWAMVVATLGMAGGLVPLVAAQDSPAGANASAPTIQPFPGSVPAESITRAMVGSEVAMHGRVTKVEPSTASNIPNRLTLAAPGGTNVMVIYWPDTAEAIEGGKGTPPVGTALAAKGKLEEFRGSLQVRLRAAEQVRIDGYAAAAASTAPAAAAPAAPRPATPPAAGGSVAFAVQPGPDGYFVDTQIAELKAKMLDQTISFKGTNNAFKARWSETSPNTISLGSEAQPLDLVYWSEEPGAYSTVGSPVYVTGRLGEYRGRLQLRADNLETLSAAPLADELVARPRAPRVAPTGPATSWPGAKPRTEAATPAAPAVVEDYAALNLREIGPEHVGAKVTTDGLLTAKKAEGDGGLLRLDASGGFLIVRADAAMLERVREGQKLRLRGKLNWDETRRQVVLVPSEQETVVE